ncbi:acyl-CoA dehydrogenase family protein [Pseudonocardia sp. KRD291]|uniref:acyl-CoA dehydrogenase family protein n=1 Tax=Pseudonocardia sp. KRD291 TaxID=2792007 RepID=UPI001C49FEE8|nr:acyl-CoA dehydrogenase family protein [Pseudonocardia sp. KRD291]MBW0101046.1 acyl-CoA dehydrogenase family protein [Pseudonocardia sp. KRD291]
MSTQLQDEVAGFVDAARGILARHWGRPNESAAGDLGKLWEVGAQQGWFELGAAGATSMAFALVRELGRAACPLPVIDGYLAARMLGEDVAGVIADGRLRVVVATADAVVDGRLRHLDAGDAATHVLVVPSGGGTVALHPIAQVTELPGIARPSWSMVTLGETERSVEVGAEDADHAVALLRLGLAARALAAAERTHEMAIEHATVRKQFGKVIGSFGAVQQRTATCEIDVRSAKLMLDGAVQAVESDSPDCVLATEVAVERISAIAPRVQLGAHHTIAATGYFEEHDGPWLFRRVHGDVARLAGMSRSAGSVADVLVETGARLPAADLGVVGEAFREQLSRFVEEHPGDESTMGDDPAVVSAMAEQGWLGFGWPREAGGREATLAEQVVLNEESSYQRLPVTSALGSVMLLGASILRHGSPEQKDHFLPLVRSGKLNFCLGYSEPEAGSDLASLRTRAVRDGDDWVINGQKLWTTNGHRADWVWLAARTDPDAQPRQAGITVFLLPMDTPGITVQQHTALSGGISCTVFYDDVRISDSARVGEVDGGWKVITDALAGERITMGNIAAGLRRQLDDLIDAVRADPAGVEAAVGPRGSAARARLGGLAAGIQATRALVTAATAAGGGAPLEAAMAGVLGGELAEDFGEATLEIFGPAAALSSAAIGTVDVPGGGSFEYGLRLSIMYVVGGGTNDIQRGLIARGLGLPR